MFEETGLHAEFESVLAFRHGHRGLFGKSDLFFVVRMRVKPGTDANNLRAQVRDGVVILGSPKSSGRFRIYYIAHDCATQPCHINLHPRGDQ